MVTNEGETRNAGEAPAADVLREDLRTLKDDAARLARDAAGRVQSGASERLEAATIFARDAIEPARRFVRERPIAALAIAFAAGWLLAPRRR